MYIKKIRESIRKSEQETEEKRGERDRRLAAVIRLQTRNKWYQAVREKRYRMASAGGGGGPGGDQHEGDEGGAGKDRAPQVGKKVLLFFTGWCGIKMIFLPDP